MPPPAAARADRPDWLLVDGSSLIFRAFFGVPRTVTAPDGRPINAIRGFLDYLARFIGERRPRNLAIATDEDWRPQFRVDLLPTYKAHRVDLVVPPELEAQIDLLPEVLAPLGIPFIGAAGYEAEDVIASLATVLGGDIEILSGDRDLFALVRDPSVRVLYPESKGRLLVVDEAEITRRYEVPGRAYMDFAILRGDPSDGLPGLPGVGAKTAAAMIRRHGDIDGILRDGSLGATAVDYLTRARTVVMPVSTIPLNRPEGGIPPVNLDPARVEELKLKHGLGGAVDRLLRAFAAG